MKPRRWTLSRDGVVRTDLRVTFRLDIGTLEKVFAAACETYGTCTPSSSVAKIRDSVRRMLLIEGTAAAENVHRDDVTEEHRAAVRRAYGDPGTDAR